MALKELSLVAEKPTQLQKPQKTGLIERN